MKNFETIHPTEGYDIIVTVDSNLKLLSVIPVGENLEIQLTTEEKNIIQKEINDYFE